MIDPFQKAETEFLRLKGQLEIGRITRAQFDAALQELRVRDAQGRWWTIHPDSGRWLVYDGQQWVPAALPVTPAHSAPPVPPTVSSQPAAPRRGCNSWLAVLAGVVVSCAILTAVLGISVNQGAVRIALGATATSLPTATFASTVRLLPTATTTPTFSPTATPLPAPTSTRTETIAPTRAATATRTRTPTPLPTAANVTFKFDEGVSQEEREFFQNAIAFAQLRLGDVGPLTVHAYANFDELAAEADRFYKRSASSEGSKTFREMFSTGKWIANGGSGAISVWISDGWKRRASAFKRKSLVHEYFHNLQAALAKKSVSSTGPIWLYEGAADIAAYAAVVETGDYSFDQVHVDKVTQSRGMLSPLGALITLQDAQIEDSEDPYQLGYLAVEYLLSKFGDDRLNVLRQFWQVQGQRVSWQDAFRTTFGMTVDEFYFKFEEYRRSQFPPFCGTVGVSLAQATPAPLGIRFVRQLAPGEMLRSEMPWTDPPNIPYVFCATGTKLPWLSSSAYKLPSGYGGWIGCGANCITVFMRPSTPAGQYTFAIELADGQRLEAKFDHTVIRAAATAGP